MQPSSSSSSSAAASAASSAASSASASAARRAGAFGFFSCVFPVAQKLRQQKVRWYRPRAARDGVAMLVVSVVAATLVPNLSQPSLRACAFGPVFPVPHEGPNEFR